MRLRFIWAMARRELRGSYRRMLLYGTCMALGIGALVGLSGLRLAVTEAVHERARELMGADLMLRARTPFASAVEDEIAALTEEGAQQARVTSFASMALAERSGRTRLLHVQAVGPAFPLYGAVETDPPGRFDRLTDGPRAVVDPAVLIQLDIEPGEVLRIGRVAFTVEATALKAPGTFGLRSSLAPRVFIPADFLEATGLVRQGSLVEYLAFLRFALPPTDGDPFVSDWIDRTRPLLEAERTTARSVQRYQRELSDSFTTLSRYLGLIGLTALLLGGVGVASGVRVFVREKLDSAALLKTLGARSAQVTAVYMSQAALLGCAGGLAGVVLGYAFQAVLPTVLAGFLPVDLSFRPDPWLAVVGLALGVSGAVLFAAWSLLELHGVPPLRALRRDIESPPRRPANLGLELSLVCLLVAASVWQAPSLGIGLWFATGVLLALGILAASAQGLTHLLRRSFPRGAAFWLRQGIANLFRPRNQTLAVVLTLGFGLFLVAIVQILQANLLTELEKDTGAGRPNMVLFDVQTDQLQAVRDLLEARGTRIDDRAPMVPARIEAIRGGLTAEIRAELGTNEARSEEERDGRWALRREYRLTYRQDLTDTETLVAGTWWNGPPKAGVPVPISFDRNLAQRLGLALGDSVSWNIQGVRVESVVASLRKIDWGRFSTNFFVVFPPGVLEEAPQSVVLLGHLAGESARAELQRDLVGQFPNVSVIDATRLLEAVDNVVGQVGLAVRFMAAFTLATGLAVLLAAASSGRFQRVREALLLRTLGASARMIRRTLATESLVLGALAASVGLLLAAVAGGLVVLLWFEQPFHLPALDLLMLWAATVAISVVLGATHLESALKQPPLAGLRRP